MAHLGRLKAPRKAVGQMDLLTVPFVDGVDSKGIQVEEALFISLLSRPLRLFRYPKGRLALELARQLARRDAHGVMPNSRQVPSPPQTVHPDTAALDTSRENALCKGFETIRT